MARLLSLAVFPLSLLVLSAIAKDPGDSDFYNTVGNHYRGNSCQEESLIWPDPVWGIGGYCSLLDYWNQEDPIVSYKVVRQYCGCNSRCHLISWAASGDASRLTVLTSKS